MPPQNPSSSTERSKEFLEGYNACAVHQARSRNPYLVGQPWLWEFPPKDWQHHADEWTEGWNTRFYGEAIYKGTPDP